MWRWILVVVFGFSIINFSISAQESPQELSASSSLPLTRTEFLYPEAWSIYNPGLRADGGYRQIEALQLFDTSGNLVMEIEVEPILAGTANESAGPAAEQISAGDRSAWRVVEADRVVYHIDLSNDTQARLMVPDDVSYGVVARAMLASLDSSYPICNVVSANTINMRPAATTERIFNDERTLPSGQVVAIDRQAPSVDEDGQIWWNLLTDEWVRADVVTEEGPCETLPENDISALYIESSNAFNERNFEVAINAMRAVLQRDPDNFFALYFRGQSYYLLDDYELAVSDFERTVELGYRPLVADWYGTTLLELGLCEAAIPELTIAIEENLPDPDIAYGDRGYCYRELGYIEEALADFNTSLDLFPDSIWTLNERGRAFIALEDYESAIADFDRAIDLDDTYAYAYVNRGISYGNLGDYDRALQDLNRAIDLDSAYALWFVSRGDIYYALEDYDAAYADYDQAINLDPLYETAYLVRGLVLEQQGASSDAAQDYFQWLELVNIEVIQGEPMMVGDTRMIEMQFGRQVHIPLDLNQGDRVTFTAHAMTEGEVDPLLILLSYDGLPITGNDDYNDSLNSQIASYSASLDGVYTLIVGHSSLGSDGSIELTITSE